MTEVPLSTFIFGLGIVLLCATQIFIFDLFFWTLGFGLAGYGGSFFVSVGLFILGLEVMVFWGI